MPLVYYHIAFILFSLSLVLLADREAVAWLRGKKEVLDQKRMRILHYLTWIGLLGLISTGLRMTGITGFVAGLTYPPFATKMIFVSALLINAFVIGYLMHITTSRSFSSLSTKERIPLFVSGAVSGISWVGAALIGLHLSGDLPFF